MFYRLSALAIAAALFPVASVNAQPASPSTSQAAFPTGLWTDAERNTVVRIASCTGAPTRFCGTLLQDNSTDRDANTINTVVLRDLVSSRGSYKGIAVFGGTTLNLTMRQGARDSAQIRMCLGVFCDTETWQRPANDQAPPMRR
jgi:uncharacterized protein (DUF2147 family)